MPHQNVSYRKDTPQLGKMIRPWLIAILAVILVAILLVRIVKDARSSMQEEKQRQVLLAQPQLTVATARMDQLEGTMVRQFEGYWRGASKSRRFISLEPNDFYVVMVDGYGNDWPIRWDGKDGWWSTSENDKGKILSLSPTRDKSEWLGIMEEKGKQIPFRILVKVKH